MALQTSVLVLGLAAAVYFDLRHRRIPNGLTVSMALAGAAVLYIGQGWSGALFALEGLLVGLALFFIPFALGGLGGGDLKLAMAVGAVLGPRLALYALVYGALAGGVLSIAVLIHRRRFQAFIPYAVPIAVGSLLAVSLGPIGG